MENGKKSNIFDDSHRMDIEATVYLHLRKTVDKRDVTQDSQVIIVLW